MTQPSYRIRLILASQYPMVRGMLARYVECEPDILVAGEAEDHEALAALPATKTTDVVVLDGLCPDVHSEEFVKRLDEILPDAVVLLTLSCELSLELESLMARIPRTWGHLAICEPARAFVETFRRVAEGKSREPHGSKDGRCPVRERRLQLLTAAERKVLKDIAQGFPSKAIADALHVTYRTVENHRLRLSKKLGLKSSAALTRYAVRAGLISP